MKFLILNSSFLTLFVMKIIVDGDACPGILIIEKLAKLADISADIICDLENGIGDEFCFLHMALIERALKNQADYNKKKNTDHF